MNKTYYSKRNGKSQNVRLNTEDLIEYFNDIYFYFLNEGCFWELEQEIAEAYDLFTIEKFGKVKILPFDTINLNYSEDDIFDLTELFFDYIKVSSSQTSNYSDFAKSFNRNGDYIKVDYVYEFRKRINRVISKFGEGYFLTEEGEVRKGVTEGLDILINTEISFDETNVSDTKNSDEIEQAKALFLHHKSTETDKRSALLILGRVLEENRKELKREFSSKDESELFELLNRFNIRHSDISQKKDYPTGIYFDWIFYNLLAAIDAFYKIKNEI